MAILFVNFVGQVNFLTVGWGHQQTKPQFSTTPDYEPIDLSGLLHRMLFLAPAAEIPVLDMEGLQNKVFAIITEFVEIQDVKECCEVVQTEVAQSNHSDFMKCYFEYAVDKKEEVCKEAGRLLYELVKTGIIAVDSVKTGYATILFLSPNTFPGLSQKYSEF